MAAIDKGLFFAGIKWQTILTLVRQLASLAAIIIVIGVFDREQYGNYQFVFLVISFFGISALSGMKTLVNQSVARGYDAVYKISSSRSFMGSCLGAFCLAFYSVYLGFSDNKDLASAFLIASLLFPFSHGLTMWQPFLLGKHEYRIFAVTQSCAAIGSQILIIICVVFRPDTIVPASLAALSINAIQNIYMHWKCMAITKKLKSTESGSHAYGFRVSFYDMFNVIGNTSERLVIFYFMSPFALAGFAVANRLPELTKDYVQSLRGVLITQLAKQPSLTKSLNRKMNQLAFLLFLLIALFAIFIIPYVFPILFTDKYDDMIIYCQILFLSVGLSNYSTLKYGFILSRLDHLSIRNIQLVSNVARVTSALTLIPIYGISGAVAAIVLYRLITVVMVNYQISKIHVLPVGKV
jgi:O-antigen/teichoic acid export membrane protein